MVDIDLLIEDLKNGAVDFTYTKLNGELRKATGTLKMDLIPVEKQPNSSFSLPLHPAGHLRYYDLTSDGWRPFHTDSVCM